MLKQLDVALLTISYMSPEIWDLVPNEMKQVTTLHEFKTWNLENCLCRLCRTYLPQMALYIMCFNTR